MISLSLISPDCTVSLKSAIGHTEGTAGAHGIAGALSAVLQLRNLRFHSLRRLSPYIENILNQRKNKFLPQRQSSGSLYRNISMSTVSSYGMSGTNTCIALEGAEESALQGEESPLLRTMNWPAILTTRFIFGGHDAQRSTVIVESMPRPQDSYMWDHIVGARPIMPGAGMFYLSTECAISSLSTSRSRLALGDAVIMNPVLLDAFLLLRFEVNVSSGVVHLFSLSQTKKNNNYASTIYAVMPDQPVQEGKLSRIENALQSRDAWMQPQRASVGQIICPNPEHYPASLDCSIHLGPATSYVKGTVQKPRAVVSVKRMILKADKNSHAMHASVFKTFGKQIIHTDHWGIQQNSQNILDHKISDLESKELMHTRQIEVQLTERYSITHQTEMPDNDRHVARHSFQNLTLHFDTPFQVKRHGESVQNATSWLSQAIQEAWQAPGKKLEGLSFSLPVLAQADACSFYLNGFKIVGASREFQSFLRVLRNEAPDTKGHIASHIGQAKSQTGFKYSANGTKFESYTEGNCVKYPVLAKNTDMFYSRRAKEFLRPHQELVVTGGMGAIGSLISLWMAVFTRSSGVFLGRTGKVKSSEKFNFMHEAFCSRIALSMADSSKKEDLAGLLYSCSDSPVTGIMHAGGQLDSKLIQNISIQSIRNVFAGKVTGASIIYSLATTLPIDALQLFSSIAAFGGVHGQSVYAAANGALDEWGDHGSMLGIPSISVQWGNWGGRGMAAEDGEFVKKMSQMGLALIQPENALDEMNNFLLTVATDIKEGQRVSTLMINTFDWITIGNSMQTIPDILRIVIEKPTKSGPTPRLKGKSPTASEALQELQGIIESLGLSIAPDQPMFSAGLDSMSLQALSEKIRVRFEVDIPVSQIFDYADPRALAEGIASSLASEPDTLSGFPFVPGESMGGMEDTEILSVSYSFPSNAFGNVYRFAFVTLPEVDNARTVPLNRWDMEQSMHLFEGM